MSHKSVPSGDGRNGVIHKHRPPFYATRATWAHRFPPATVVGVAGGWKQLWCQSSAVPPEICLILFSVGLWPPIRGGHWRVCCSSLKRVSYFNGVHLSISPVAVGVYRRRKEQRTPPGASSVTRETWHCEIKEEEGRMRLEGGKERLEQGWDGEGAGLWKQLEARGWKLNVLEGGCKTEREGEEGSARGLLRRCFSCQPAINGMARAVACVCQGCRWHFCHRCDWHLPYCSTHCTFSVLYDALNGGRNMESGRNGGGSRTHRADSSEKPNPDPSDGSPALAVPDEPWQKEDSAICQKAEKRAGRRFSISISREGRS